MWETLSKTHTQLLAQDAMKFLFGAPEDLIPEQRAGAMFGDVPILHLYVAHSMLMTNPIYFTMKTAGIFVCNSPELVEQLKQEDQALDNMVLINSFIAAAQRKLWSDFGFTLKRQPSFRALNRTKFSQRQEQVDQSNSQPNTDTNTTESTTLPTDVWDVHQYPILLRALKRYAFAHQRMELANTKVESHLLAPLGVNLGNSGELVTMLERLGVYESQSNVYLLRSDFAGENLLSEFPTEIREAYDPKLLSQVPDLDKNRKDLRTLPVYTVDSASTVEIDDGLSLEYRGPEQTEWILIHIADPTRWIVPNGPLDLAARKRVSTLYLPEVVQAMLPLEIARDVMSIIPSHLSHALTFAVRLDEDGSAKEYEIFPSLIQNIKRTTFEYVDSVLNSDKMVEPVLHRLYEIALKRSAWRTQNGAFTTNLPKSQVELDSDLNISLTFECNTVSRAQLLVQEMMILTGQLSATYATTFDIPVPYRSQQPPQVESEEYDQFLKTLPPIVREFEYVSVAKRATVATTPARHHGVGLDGYSRASSPIRRYHDMLVHHQIKAHIRGDPLPYSREEIEKIVKETAARDNVIHFLQKDSQRFWQMKYIEQHKDRKYTGLVLRVSEHGIEVLVMEVGLKCKLKTKEEYEVDGTIKTYDIKRGQVVPLEVLDVTQFSATFQMLTLEEEKKKEQKQVEQ